MTLKIATWNINSVRHREAAVLRFLREEAPDILCLQETKTPVDKFPLDGFRALGYRHVVTRGQKAYNGVAILSRVPLEDAGQRDFCTRGDARHVAARLPSGAILHNLYIPAGGDVPDRGAQPEVRPQARLPRRAARAGSPTRPRAARSSSATSTSPRARTTSGTTGGS